jgi:hypothetical protein
MIGKLSIAFLLAACASVPAPRQPEVPENLKVPEGQKLLLRAAARGAQIYSCKAKAADSQAFEWVLKAPDAELFDERGAKIGRHYAGPTWESADGSRVVCEVLQRSAVKDAVPWLLLRARPNEGSGAFTKVTYIQRIDYSANYYFYSAR